MTGVCEDCGVSGEVHPLDTTEDDGTDRRERMLCVPCTSKVRFAPLPRAVPSWRQPLSRRQVVSAFIGAALMLSVLVADGLHPSSLTRTLVWTVLASGVVVPLVERAVKRRR